MSLPLDNTRCLGEGSAGAVCPKREQCLRYTDRPAGSAVRLSFVAMLCRGEKWDGFIPVRDAGNKIA